MRSATPLSAIAFATLATLPAAAHDAAAPAAIVTGGNTTIVYVFPTSPQTFVPIDGLPSFLAMPGAVVPTIATHVVYSTPRPVPSSRLISSVDVDCNNFTGDVKISGPDTFNLDRDNDGIGCEPEDR